MPSLPDHAPVPATALAQLRREAAAEGALLVTTEKASVRPRALAFAL